MLTSTIAAVLVFSCSIWPVY